MEASFLPWVRAGCAASGKEAEEPFVVAMASVGRSGTEELDSVAVLYPPKSGESEIKMEKSASRAFAFEQSREHDPLLFERHSDLIDESLLLVNRLKLEPETPPGAVRYRN